MRKNAINLQLSAFKVKQILTLKHLNFPEKVITLREKVTNSQNKKS